MHTFDRLRTLLPFVRRRHALTALISYDLARQMRALHVSIPQIAQTMRITRVRVRQYRARSNHARRGT
jgi:hypothetical protein